MSNQHSIHIAERFNDSDDELQSVCNGNCRISLKEEEPSMTSLGQVQHEPPQAFLLRA